MAILRVKHGPNKGMVYELSDKTLTLGREPGERDGIVLPDQGVSRRHAEVAPIGDLFFIRDLESRNGTFVNEETIREEALRYGDRVRIGNSVLVFEERLAHLKDSSRLMRDTGGVGAVNPSSTIQFRLTDLASGTPPLPPDAVDTTEKRNLNVLFHVAHILNDESNLSTIHGRIAEVLGRNVKADHTYILWRGEGANDAKDGDPNEEFELLGRFDANGAGDPQNADGTLSSGGGVSRGIIHDCMTQGRAILTADAAFDQQFQAMESVVVNQLHAVLCVPITVLGEQRGVVYSYSSKPDAFNSDDLELCSVIGIQLGAAIGLLKAVRSSDQFFRNSIQALVSASEMRTPETRGHCERVAMYCLAMGKELDFGTHELRNAWLVGMLHNIGIIPMTDAEQQQSLTADTKKNHYAREILRVVPSLSEILPAIECQKEHVDGSGVPEGKKGDDIPLLGRILCAAIELDQLLYGGVTLGGEELSIKDALMKVRDQAAKKFDKEVVRAMLVSFQKGRLMNADEEFFELPF